MKTYDLVVAGGGAAGFFAAINAVTLNPSLKVTVLEKSSQYLGKVKISGGGRCNVTHACFDPKELSTYYPRGHKELIGPFHTFQPADVFQWFTERGVELKVEDDNRVFPVTDNSQTIIDCFLSEIHKLGITLQLQTGLDHFVKDEGVWKLTTNRGVLITKNLLIASGSSAKLWAALGESGIKISPPAPSLFTFNVSHPLLADLPGIVINPAEVSVKGANLSEPGPLLITHWGLSGPAVLKLSAWGARYFQQCGYKCEIEVDFLPGADKQKLEEELKKQRFESARKLVVNQALFGLPARFWRNLVLQSGLTDRSTWADLSNQQMKQLYENLKGFVFHITGKSTFKDEFVTCGGVDLKEVDFKTMESKKHQGLYFAGEVLDIDAVTGGFNFQAAWTTAYIAAVAVSSKFEF